MLHVHVSQTLLVTVQIVPEVSGFIDHIWDLKVILTVVLLYLALFHSILSLSLVFFCFIHSFFLPLSLISEVIVNESNE